MEPLKHPIEESRQIGEVSNWDTYCLENGIGDGKVDWMDMETDQDLLEKVEVWISEVKVSLETEIMEEERQVEGCVNKHGTMYTERS